MLSARLFCPVGAYLGSNGGRAPCPGQRRRRSLNIVLVANCFGEDQYNPRHEPARARPVSLYNEFRYRMHRDADASEQRELQEYYRC
jgi:hypothetical protein